MKVLAIFNNDRCDLIIQCPSHDYVINGAWDCKVNLNNKTIYCDYTGDTHSYEYAEEIEVKGGGYSEVMWKINQMNIPDTGRYKRTIQNDDYGLGFNIL